MDFKELHLWERAALPPPRGDAPPKRVRHVRAPAGIRAAQDLDLARRRRDRLRAATTHGLFLSVMLSVPLGWSFVRSAFFTGDPATAQECPDLSGFLAPQLQRTLDEKRATGELTRDQRRALDMKVCDSSLQLLLRPILGGVSDLAGLRHMAGSAPSAGEGTEVLPALMTVLGGPGT